MNISRVDTLYMRMEFTFHMNNIFWEDDRMSMEKRIVGTFNSEQEVLYAIEGLKRQGHRETDMMVVAENRSDIPLVTSRTGVMVEADTNEYLSRCYGGQLFYHDDGRNGRNTGKQSVQQTY